MKPKNSELFLPLLLLFAGTALASDKKAVEAPKDDFMAGSVVKSDDWEIDRVKNIETFKGHVSFRNSQYKLNADNAVYHHKTKKWDMRDNVYSLRTFENGARIEMFCDSAEYFENMQKSTLHSGKNRVKSVYHSPGHGVMTGLSDRLDADNSAGTLNFSGNFTVFTDSATVIGEKGVYRNSTGEFAITGNTPFAVGINEKHQTYLEGELITLNKDTHDISAYRNVKGLVVSKDGESLFKKKTGAAK